MECKNCKVQERAQALYGDVVPLTSELSKYLKGGTNNAGVPDSKRTLASLKPKDVVPFLRDNLKWRITLVSLVYPLHPVLQLPPSHQVPPSVFQAMYNAAMTLLR